MGRIRNQVAWTGVDRSRILSLVSVLGLLCATGCSSGKQRVLESDKRGEPESFTVQSPPSVTPLTPRTVAQEDPEEPAKLMIYGGRKHDVYLGCLSCNAPEPESIFNEFGSYGSPYSPYSIHNVDCDYGNAGSPLSPLNPRATTPPVIFDQRGHFYGYLTVNDHMPQAFRDAHVRAWLERVRGR